MLRRRFSGPIAGRLLYHLLNLSIGHILEELSSPNLITELLEKKELLRLALEF